MPMSAERRAEYLRRSGVTEEELGRTTGGFNVDEVNARASDATREDITAARAGVQAVVGEASVISANYNALALRMDQDAREVAAPQDVAADRAALESLIAPEYRFTDPRGNVGDRDTTIQAILSGRVRKDTFGAGGFETTKDTFQVHGDSSVSVGEFVMTGSAMARNRKTGEVARRSRSGTYRTTHTYIYRDGRWQVTASQMTRVPVDGPDDVDWEFLDD